MGREQDCSYSSEVSRISVLGIGGIDRALLRRLSLSSFRKRAIISGKKHRGADEAPWKLAHDKMSWKQLTMDCIIHHKSRLPGQRASVNREEAFDEESGCLKSPDESLRGHAQPRRRLCLSPKTCCDDVVAVGNFELSRTKHAKADLVECSFLLLIFLFDLRGGLDKKSISSAFLD